MRASLRLAVIFLASMGMSLASDSSQRPGDSLREARLERAGPADWFLAQRAYPGTTVRQSAYRAAVTRVQLECGAARASAAQSGATWAGAGPYNIGGRVTALAVANGGVDILLGSADGGVFRSNDSGASWAPVFDAVG